MSPSHPVTILALALVAGCLVSWSSKRMRFAVPPHLLGHPIVDKPNFLSSETVDELLQWTRELETIPSVLRDTDSYKVVRAHIGEAVPFNNETMSCPKEFPFLVPDPNREWCIFPGRLDVGKHFIFSGGVEGLKESFSTLSSRVQPFIRYAFDYEKYPVAKKLLESPEFQELAKSVCPPEKQGKLDYFQFNLVVQVPGQTVAMHTDAPVFYHANRFYFPQWLLVAMTHSGLFQDDFVHQVQVVAYYHKWNTTQGGNFYFWDDDSGRAKICAPASRSANSVDGSKVVHAASVFKPQRKPPALDQNAVNELRYNAKTNLWDVVSNGVVKASYDESEIRFGAVYRARCFADDRDFAAFQEGLKHQHSIEHVLDKFRADMDKKGVATDGLSRYDLALKILDTYVRYPLSESAWIPYNYCALGKLYPWMDRFLGYICD